MKRKIVSRMAVVFFAVLMCVLSFIPSASAAEGFDLNSINLDDYGDVITNEELGYNLSTSGIFTKKQLEEIINSPSMMTRAASTTVSLTKCYDSNGKLITAASSTYFHRYGGEMYRIKSNSDGSNAYCIEPGIYLAGGINLNTSAAEVWNNLTDNQQRAINAALCFGLEGSKSTVTAGAVNDDEAYIATQLIVWEFVTGERKTTAPFGLNSGKNGYLSLFCAGGANPNIRTAYNRITTGLTKFQAVPSMTNYFQSLAPTYTLTAVYNEQKNYWTYGSMTINDSNEVLSNFSLTGTFDVGNAKVKITRSGNNLTLTCSDGKLTGTPKSVTVKSNKTGIPTTNEGSLVAYGSPYAQDVVLGGMIDPPVAYINVKVNIKKTGTLTRDGRIQKSCWTVSESNDDTTEEGEGSLSTEENLQGWYYYVEGSNQFQQSYGVKNFILGPTDKAGFTQTLSEYILKNIDDELTHDVPAGIYTFYELGKLKSGASGRDLNNDYYFPDNWRAANGYYGNNIQSGSIRIEVNSTSLSEIGHAANIFEIPFKFKKISECGSTVANFYFTVTNKQTGAVYLLRTAKSGYAYLNSDSSKSTTIHFPEGEYVLHELGQLKAGASGRNYNTDYEIPAYYDKSTDIEFEISADAYKAAQEDGKSEIEVTMTNTVSSYIKIEKKDKETGSAIKDAVFGIYLDKACTSLLDTLTTGTDGTATSAHKYSTGTYYVQEITPPKYYKLDETVHTVEVKPVAVANNVVTVSATNEKYPASVRIYKVDEETKRPLSGAKFGIYSNEACTVLLETLTSDSTGYALTKEYYPGTALYIKELKAPTGYIASTTPTKVVIPNNTQAGVKIGITMTNPVYKVPVAIVKSDVETGEKLEGAVYGLYSDKACTKLLEKLTTDSNGYAESNTPYRPSTMYIKEITPPENYIANDTVYTVTITVDHVVARKPVKIEVKDEIEKVRIFLFKYDPDLMAKGKGVAGATYGFYSNSACTQLYEKVVSGSDGSVISAKKYRMGDTIYIKELSPAKGYKLNTIIYDITVTPEYIEQSKQLFHPALEEPDEPYVWIRVYDEIYKPYIQIHKTDSKTGVAVKGAVYELYDPSNKWATRNMLETDSNGYAKTISTYYPGQTLHLKEYKAADGYTLDPNTYEVYVKYVDKDNEVILVEVKNDPKDISLTIKKTCSQTKLPVKGATYGVYSSNAKDSNGMLLEANRLTSVVTGQNGLAKINIKFAAGEVFYLQEITAPYGYSLNKQIVTVTVKENMNPIIEVTNYIKSGTVYIDKYDAKGNSLVGVTFEMYTSDGTRVHFGNYGASTYYYSLTGPKDTITMPSDGDGVAIISLPLGDYYLVETGTVDGKMPYGEKIEFSVKLKNATDAGAGTQQINVKNHDSVLWNTGGTGNNTFYTVAYCILGLSVMLVTTALAVASRKEKTKN